VWLGTAPVGLTLQPCGAACYRGRIFCWRVYAECYYPIWTAFANTSVASINYRPASTTLESCQAVCFSYQNCLSIDWNPNGAIWCKLIKSNNGLWNNGTAPGVTHYELQRNASCKSKFSILKPVLAQLTPATIILEVFVVFSFIESCGRTRTNAVAAVQEITGLWKLSNVPICFAFSKNGAICLFFYLLLRISKFVSKIMAIKQNSTKWPENVVDL